MDPTLSARVDAAAALLRRGGIVAYPTETFYGLGALARDADAVRRLAHAKGRPDGKPLPLVAADVAMVEEVAELGPVGAALAARFWPGPLTLVLPARGGLPDEITGGTGTVGIRVPGSDIARALCRAAGGPLVSTSANVSGSPPAARVEDLAAEVASRLDGVLDGGPAPGGLASTVVALDGVSVRLVRAGPVAIEEVQAAAGAVPPGALHPRGR